MTDDREQRLLTFPLSVSDGRSNIARLEFLNPMTPEEYEQMLRLLEVFRPGIVR